MPENLEMGCHMHLRVSAGSKKTFIVLLFALLLQIVPLAVTASEDIKTRFTNDFMLALSQGQADRARQILQDYPAVARAVDVNGNSVILMAISQCPDLIEPMVKAGADPNYSLEGCPMLYMVAASANPALKAMLRAGANPNLTEPSGAAPVHLAIANGDLEAVKLMVEYGLNLDIKYDNRSLKEFALEKNQQAIADWLAEAKPGTMVQANTNPATPPEKQTETTAVSEKELPAGTSAVSREIFREEWIKALNDANLESVKFLIDKGVDLNAGIDSTGWALPPLILIMYHASCHTSGHQGNQERFEEAWKTRLPIALLLLERGADPDISVGIEKGAPAWPALHWAAIEAFDRPEMIEALLARGARPYKGNNDQTTMEIFASIAEDRLRGKPELWPRYMKIYRQIIKATGNPDLMLTGNITQLHRFAGVECPPGDAGLLRAMSDELFACGANMNPQLPDALTAPLHIAVSSAKTSDFALYLIEQGANVNIRDKAGMTPLFNLAESYDGPEQLKVGSALLKKGADLHASYYLYPENTIMHVANRYPELFALFKKHGGTCKYKGIDEKTPCESCRKAAQAGGAYVEPDEETTDGDREFKLQASLEPEEIWLNSTPEKNNKVANESNIRVVVTDSEGKPAPGLSIDVKILGENDSLIFTSLKTDSDGKASTLCRPGLTGSTDFEVSVRPNGPEPAKIQLRAGGLTLTCREVGQTMLLLDGKTPVEFEARVISPSGEAVSGVEIKLEADEKHLDGNGRITPKKGRADADGRCIFTYLPPASKNAGFKGGDVVFSAHAIIPDKMRLTSVRSISLSPHGGYNMHVRVKKDGFVQKTPFKAQCSSENGKLSGRVCTLLADGRQVPVAFAEVVVERPDGAKLIGGSREETDADGRFTVAFASDTGGAGDQTDLSEAVTIEMSPEVSNNLTAAREQFKKLKERGNSSPIMDDYLENFVALLAAAGSLHGENRASASELVSGISLMRQVNTHLALLDEKARDSIEEFNNNLKIAVDNLSETWEFSDKVAEGAKEVGKKGREFLGRKVGRLRSAIPQLEGAIATLDASCRKLKLDLLKALFDSVYKVVKDTWIFLDNRLSDLETLDFDVEAIQTSSLKGGGDYLFKPAETLSEKLGETVNDKFKETILDYYAGLASASHEVLVGNLLQRASLLAMEGRLFWSDPQRAIALTHDMAVGATNRHQAIFSRDYLHETTAAWLEVTKIFPGTYESFYAFFRSAASAKNWDKLCEEIEKAENIDELLKPFKETTKVTDQVYGTGGAILRTMKGLKFIGDIRDMQATMTEIILSITRSIGKD